MPCFPVSRRHRYALWSGIPRGCQDRRAKRVLTAPGNPATHPCSDGDGLPGSRAPTSLSLPVDPSQKRSLRGAPRRAPFHPCWCRRRRNGRTNPKNVARGPRATGPEGDGPRAPSMGGRAKPLHAVNRPDSALHPFPVRGRAYGRLTRNPRAPRPPRPYAPIALRRRALASCGLCGSARLRRLRLRRLRVDL